MRELDIKQERVSPFTMNNRSPNQTNSQEWHGSTAKIGDAKRLDTAIIKTIQRLVEEGYITQRKLAIECGVAPSTISRALQLPDMHFRPDVRKKLLRHPKIDKGVPDIKGIDKPLITIPLIGQTYDGMVHPVSGSAISKINIPDISSWINDEDINKLYALKLDVRSKYKILRGFIFLFMDRQPNCCTGEEINFTALDNTLGHLQVAENKQKSEQWTSYHGRLRYSNGKVGVEAASGITVAEINCEEIEFFHPVIMVFQDEILDLY